MVNHKYGRVILISLLVFLVFAPTLSAQTRAIAIVGGTFIDGTGRAAIEDALVIFQNGRIQEVGKRGEVAVPRGAEVIDAKGKTVLPGLIDGHCHYWEWIGELHLAYGVTTCPDINNSPTEWIIAQKEGIQKGKIRGPRLWISGHAIDGPRPPGHAGAALAARQRDRPHRRRGAQSRSGTRQQRDGRFPSFSSASPPTWPESGRGGAQVGEAGHRPFHQHLRCRRRGLHFRSSTRGRSCSRPSAMFRSAPEIDMSRMTGKVGTVEAHINMAPEHFDEIIKAMVTKDVHWSPAWATQFRALSPRAADMKKRELAILKNPALELPAAVQRGSSGRLFRRLREDDSGKTRDIRQGL